MLQSLLPSSPDFWWSLATGLLGGTTAFLISRYARRRMRERELKFQQELDAQLEQDPAISPQTPTLSEVEQAVREMCEAAGTAFDRSEVQRIVEPILRENRQLRRKLESYNTMMQEQARQLRSYITQAQTDGLTGLANRRCFDDLLQRRLAERQRHQMPFSLILFDIDHFKLFNDTYGHLAGDMVLKGVAKIITSSIRDLDLGARFGGEEFGVILTDADLNVARKMAEQIRTQIDKSYFCVNDSVLHVTVSAGITELQSSDSVDDVVRRADAALYDAKASGRNQSKYLISRGAAAAGGSAHESFTEPSREEIDETVIVG